MTGSAGAGRANSSTYSKWAFGTSYTAQWPLLLSQAVPAAQTLPRTPAAAHLHGHKRDTRNQKAAVSNTSGSNPTKYPATARLKPDPRLNVRHAPDLESEVDAGSGSSPSSLPAHAPARAMPRPATATDARTIESHLGPRADMAEDEAAGRVWGREAKATGERRRAVEIGWKEGDML